MIFVFQRSNSVGNNQINLDQEVTIWQVYDDLLEHILEDNYLIHLEDCEDDQAEQSRKSGGFHTKDIIMGVINTEIIK